MQWEEVEVGEPGEGEARVRQTAIGVNFIDVYHRSGLYPLPLPFVPGSEGAGIVEAIGPGVKDVKVGQRVAYAGIPGAYAEQRLAKAERLVVLPDAIDDVTAAAIMLKGMTARYLVRETYRVKSGDRILVHAAAGGVGTILCQWAKHLGATVIGTVGSEDKAAVARAHGCDHAIVYTREDFLARTRELTHGAGVDVVYDSVGKDTFERSLQCVRTLGHVVSFGQSSGPIPPFDVLVLGTRGSLTLTRPVLGHYIARRDALLANAADLFEVIARGVVKVEKPRLYALEDAADAHRDLEGRKTTGSVVLRA